jgi:hypothetical protein
MGAEAAPERNYDHIDGIITSRVCAGQWPEGLGPEAGSYESVAPAVFPLAGGGVAFSSGFAHHAAILSLASCIEGAMG